MSMEKRNLQLRNTNRWRSRKLLRGVEKRERSFAIIVVILTTSAPIAPGQRSASYVKRRTIW